MLHLDATLNLTESDKLCTREKWKFMRTIINFMWIISIFLYLKFCFYIYCGGFWFSHLLWMFWFDRFLISVINIEWGGMYTCIVRSTAYL